MSLLRMLKTDFLKGILSISFFISITSITIFKFLGIVSFITKDSSVFSLYYNSDTSPFGSIRYIFTALPFASVFVSDLKNNYVVPQAIRAGVIKYAVSKVIIAAVCGAAALFLGELLFIFLSSCFFPVVSSDNIINLQIANQVAYGNLALNGNYVLYFLTTIFCKSLIAIPLAITAMLISTKIENHFVVVFSPLLIYYLILNITGTLPQWLSLRAIFNGTSDIFNNPTINFLYTLAFALILGTILGILCTKSIIRRVHID